MSLGMFSSARVVMVEFNPLRGLAVAQSLSQPPSAWNSGLDQDDTVHLAARWSALRTFVAAPMVPVMHRHPLVLRFGDPLMTGDVELGLALEWCCQRLSELPVASRAPERPMPGVLPAGWMLVAITGAAVSVLTAAAAAWRTLTERDRLAMAAIDSAGAAYGERVRTWTETGRMPPPGEVERAAAGAIATAAAERRGTRWGQGAVAVGGVLGGLGLSMLARRFA